MRGGWFSLGALVIVAASPASASDARMALPLVIGRTAMPPMTVESVIGCLGHDPIPLKTSDIAAEGKAGFLVRLVNDLQQVDLHFTVADGRATLAKLDRDNGGNLRSEKDLRRFVARACAQAKHG